jgi:hypothetical protein
MRAAGVLAVCAALAAAVLAQAVIPQHNLPELFSYNHGSHSVAVYRGAALKAAIAAGVVKGFGAGASRQAKAVVALPPPPPAPMCCASRRLSGELANMKRQLAALQASLAAMDPELMALPLCP